MAVLMWKWLRDWGPAPDPAPVCGNGWAMYYRCDLPAGHTGMHESHGHGHTLAAWGSHNG